MTSWMTWIGHFHIVVIHFPIALIFAALLAEIASLFRAREVRWFCWPPSRWCLNLAAVTGTLALPLGMWHADLGGFGSMTDLIEQHRWFGYTATFTNLVAAISSEVDFYDLEERTWRTRILILIGALLTGYAAHLGGLSVHSPDFFNFAE